MKNLVIATIVLLSSIYLTSCQKTPLEQPDINELTQAIKSDDDKYIRWYIGQKFNLDRLDKDGKTALMQATQLGKTSIVKLLLDARAGVSIKDQRDFDVMFYAVSRNRIDIAELLITAGYPIQAENDVNAMNLIMAVDFNYLDLVNMLIDKGHARIDFPNLKEPKSLLVEAILQDTGMPFIESLIERGASLDAVHHARHHHQRSIMIDYNPVIAAILAYNPRALVFLTLRNSSADKVNGIERYDDAAYYAVQMNAPDLLEIVLGNAIYSDQKKKYNELLIEAARDCAKCIPVLAERGLDPDYYGDDKDKMTPLMLAAWKNNTEQISMLLKLGARIDQQDRLGRTALYLAAGNGYTDSVKLLVEHGANAKLGTMDVWTPLLNAISSGHYLTADYLKQVTQDKTDIEAIITKREKDLFFSSKDLDSCRELQIDSQPHELCIESNHALKRRNYTFSVKKDGMVLHTQPIATQPGINLRHFAIFLEPITTDKILVRIPEVKGMPNRYQYLVNQYYLLSTKNWNLQPVWASPKCDYPCNEPDVAIEQRNDAYDIRHATVDSKTGKRNILSFTIDNL